jgi:hypothetical protein
MLTASSILTHPFHHLWFGSCPFLAAFWYAAAIHSQHMADAASALPLLNAVLGGKEGNLLFSLYHRLTFGE